MTAPTDATSLAAQVPTSEVLYGAADHIAAFGHHKGGGVDTSAGLWVRVSPACTIGAITLAGRKYQAITEAVAAFRKYLGEPIISWNDAPERTAEEIIAALRSCAVIAAAKEAPTVAREKAAEGAGAVAS